MMESRPMTWVGFVFEMSTDRLTNSLIISVEQSPFWAANWFSASQEIPCILWNPKVYYLVQKDRPPLDIMSLINPVHASLSYFFQTHLIISSHLRLDLISGVFPSCLRTMNLYTPLLSPLRVTCLVHLIW
jgi:hypothetical protein